MASRSSLPPSWVAWLGTPFRGPEATRPKPPFPQGGFMITKPPLSEAAKRAMHRQAPDGARRAARARACPHCGQPTMHGLDDDVAACAVRVDAYPLSQAGELAALIAGRPTYALRWVAGRARYEIDFRHPLNIEKEPAGTVTNLDVVVGHQCGAAYLDRLATSHTRRDAGALPIEAPF